MLKYKRVSLKLSGEAMGGGKTIDFAAVAAIARMDIRCLFIVILNLSY